MAKPSTARYLVKSVIHAAEVMGAFRADGEVLRLKDVVERTGYQKALCFRLLSLPKLFYVGAHPLGAMARICSFAFAEFCFGIFPRSLHWAGRFLVDGDFIASLRVHADQLLSLGTYVPAGYFA